MSLTVRSFVGTLLTTLLANVVSVASAHAQTSDRQGTSLARANPVTRIGQNALDSFSGYNLLLHASGIAATPLLVFSGADAAAHDAFARHQMFEPYSVVGVYLGYGLPLVVGGGLLSVGLATSSQREVVAASAVIQATILALGYQSVLKALTGRPPPPEGSTGDARASREFRLGFLRGGIHYGWPSGHLMVTSAVAASLNEVYADSLAMKLGSAALILGMFGSVAVHEDSSMHWLSDMVCGTVSGLAIGRGVGAGFVGSTATASAERRRLRVGPLLGTPGARGVAVSGDF